MSWWRSSPVEVGKQHVGWWMQGVGDLVETTVVLGEIIGVCTACGVGEVGET